MHPAVPSCLHIYALRKNTVSKLNEEFSLQMKDSIKGFGPPLCTPVGPDGTEAERVCLSMNG